MDLADLRELDLIVIGAGPGGLAWAKRAKALYKKVLLIEAEKYGGTWVNTGCVPNKLMYEAANFADDLKNAEAYGFEVKYKFDW